MTWQNICFMFKLAWDFKEKKVLFLCLLVIIFLNVIRNIVNLFLLLTVLFLLERNFYILEIIKIIAYFCLGLIFINGLFSYIDSNVVYCKITIRKEIINLINKKACTTSYLNLSDDKFQNLLSKSFRYTSCDDECTESIWANIVTFVINLLSFFSIYFVIGKCKNYYGSCYYNNNYDKLYCS